MLGVRPRLMLRSVLQDVVTGNANTTRGGVGENPESCHAPHRAHLHRAIHLACGVNEVCVGNGRRILRHSVYDIANAHILAIDGAHGGCPRHFGKALGIGYPVSKADRSAQLTLKGTP